HPDADGPGHRSRRARLAIAHAQRHSAQLEFLMSFILDALKKSELERQRQVVPGLMDSRAARPRTRLPLWAIGLMLLLGFNLTVLTVVLTRGGLNASHNGASGSAPRPNAAPGVAPGI